MRYIVFDVETPNYANDRMSAIGVTIIDENAVSREFYTLINPETHFDSFNIHLTGITPQMVENKPTFGQLWTLLEPYFNSGLLIAHNAPFDMGVLAKCLRAYGINWKSTADYACTCKMGRACYPQLANHKLHTMCDYLRIPLDHHNAGSDSHACAMLLLDYLQHGLNVEGFRRSYALQRCASGRW